MSKKVLSKFTIVCWAAFIVILGHGLDTPESWAAYTAFKKKEIPAFLKVPRANISLGNVKVLL